MSALSLMLLLAAGGCADDTFDDLPDYTLVGEPVKLRLNLRLPVMDERTRADRPVNDLNSVETLWVRTYSAQTGHATSDWLKIERDPSDIVIEDPDTKVNVDLTTLSGYNYIVGVANVVGCPAVTRSDIENRTTLDVLLDAADTWEKFLDIAVVSPSDFDDVYAAPVPVPMAGCYVDIDPGDTHPNGKPEEWESRDFTSFFIPAKKGTMVFESGAIHLRRLVSHVKFNVIPHADLDVTVNSYTVFNAPKFSWLYERAGAEGGKYGNFGDAATSSTDAERYYAGSIQYPMQYVTKNQDGSSTFDFWQGENKHVGNAGKYTDRDACSTDGMLYTSLTGSTWTPNNMASYVRINCTVSYKNNKELTVNDKGEIKDDGNFKVHRVGTADYIIHLGNIFPPQEKDKAADFSCYRNTKYTYNVTVNGADDIRVDAWADQESYPGEEGIVSDIEYSTVELDSHYNTFNIRLTEGELKQADFGYIITTYFGGIPLTLDEHSDLTKVDSRYYNWVELAPTTGEGELASYKPRTAASSTTFLLTDLKRGDKATVWENMPASHRSASGWYTVFINENTYEKMYGEEGYGNEESSDPAWRKYVNQNPRRCYIRVTRSQSADGKSVYARSKYSFSQRSIQTYYAANSDASSAIGLEMENETEGLNMRSTIPLTGTSGFNGRYNTNLWIQNQSPLYRYWADFVVNTPLERPAVTGERTQSGPELPARTISSGNPMPIAGLKLMTGESSVFNYPQANGYYTIQAMNACMSRNRDNDGDGSIDKEELRWYIPAMGKYFRLLIGSESMTDPVMSFKNIGTLPKVSGVGTSWINWNDYGSVNTGSYSRYLYAASDFDSKDSQLVLWAIEGMSTSNWKEAHNWGGGYPWQVKCIRNLGTDLTTIDDVDKVKKAYVIDKSARMVEMKHYDARSIRQTMLWGNGPVGNVDGAMPIHDIISLYNKPYRRFEYAENDIDVSDKYMTVSDIKAFLESNPCKKADQRGWRVPNQKEIAILMTEGVLSDSKDSKYVWMSCTYGYFNNNSGVGGGYENGQNLFMAMMSSHGLMMTENNFKNLGLGGKGKVRCVRDVN